MGGKFWDTCSPWTTPPAQSLPTTVKPPMPCFSVKHLNLIQHPNFFLLIYFNRRLISLQYCGGFCMHWHQSATGVHVDPSWTSPPPGLSQCTGFECPVSCIELGLVMSFTYGNIHVSMLFSQIIPPSPSPTESKSLFFTSVSLLLSCIQGHWYHLSKFHIYALVYCIGVVLSDLLHSVQQAPVSSTSLELIQMHYF